MIGYEAKLPEVDEPVIVVGPYRTQCGGCDAIPTQDLVCEAVRQAARRSPYVFFEGLLVSGIYARYQALSDELKAQGHRYVWGIYSTPLSVCLERVYARKPIKEELVAMKLRGVESAERKAKAAGEEVVSIPYKRPFSTVLKALLDKKKL